QSGCDLGFGVSYSKNASLYSERVGGTFIRVKNPQEKAEIESQTYRLIRQSLSCLPQYGVRIMNNIFDQKRGQWIAELEGVRKDITERKNNFIKILPPSFEYLNHCRGMFGMMYLSQSKVQMLKEKYSIYLTLDSRVNFAGIRDQDYEYLAEVLPKVLN
ncbi:MAG TPA: aminotransferase class I/II-fold pyridoxal phosphate-dependent enzyme, partial [Candidatus Gracilibacteria bacterium]